MTQCHLVTKPKIEPNVAIVSLPRGDVEFPVIIVEHGKKVVVVVSQLQHHHPHQHHPVNHVPVRLNDKTERPYGISYRNNIHDPSSTQ